MYPLAHRRDPIIVPTHSITVSADPISVPEHSITLGLSAEATSRDGPGP